MFSKQYRKLNFVKVILLAVAFSAIFLAVLLYKLVFSSPVISFQNSIINKNESKDSEPIDQNPENDVQHGVDASAQEIIAPDGSRPASNLIVAEAISLDENSSEVANSESRAREESTGIPIGLSPDSNASKSTTTEKSVIDESECRSSEESTQVTANIKMDQILKFSGQNLRVQQTPAKANDPFKSISKEDQSDAPSDSPLMQPPPKENDQRLSDAAASNLSAQSRANTENKLAKNKSTPKHGDIYTNSLGMRFVYISPGSFLMGSREKTVAIEQDENLHRVTITKGFFFQTTEVSQGQWIAVMGVNPSRFQDAGLDHPVENISWYDARTFLNRLNLLLEQTKYRLPTEAEWEFAARAGSAGPYCFGLSLTTDQANFNGRLTKELGNKDIFRECTSAVGSFTPNAWGLYDMYGNVMEWCQDYYGRYKSGEAIDPTGPNSGQFRSVRGGGWYSPADHCRSSFRDFDRPERRDYGIGFRIALDEPISKN